MLKCFGIYVTSSVLITFTFISTCTVDEIRRHYVLFGLFETCQRLRRIKLAIVCLSLTVIFIMTESKDVTGRI